MKKIKEELRKIKEEVIACRKCDLYKTRTLPVVGVGDHEAKIMFIGEAPGANEDRTGVPFCGAAGKILDELLASVDIKREDVYIANILKCRPPGNRDPLPDEKMACIDFLKRQIDIINPKVICAMGNHAAKFILEYFGLGDKVQGISKIQGRVFPLDDKVIIPLYHPAVAVYNASTKNDLKKSFQVLKDYK